MTYEKIVDKVGAGFYISPNLRDTVALVQLWSKIEHIHEKEIIERIVKSSLKGHSKRWIVSAAIRIRGYWPDDSDLVLATPRHFTEYTHAFIKSMWSVPELERRYKSLRKAGLIEQGFIDAFGNYLTRREAMECVRFTGQPFLILRSTGSKDELYSEDLYGWQCY